MKLFRIGTLLVLLSFTLVITGFSQPIDQRFAFRGKEKQMRGLNLNDEQREQVAQLRLELKKQNLPLRAKLNDYQAQLKLLVVDDQFSTARAREILEKIENIRQQMALNRLLFQRKFRALLTPEQRIKFDNRLLTQGKTRHFLRTSPPGRHALRR